MEKVPEWEELIIELPHTFSAFRNSGQKLSILRNNEQVQYINENSLCNYELLFGELLGALNEHSNGNTPQPLKHWILLGAVTEVTLQIILAVYYTDYIKERWQLWDGVDVESVKNELSKVLQQEVELGKLTPQQKKSISGAISKKIEEHTSEHSIRRIMLEELIQFAEKTGLLYNDSLLDQLRIIQRNRNGIHAFSDRGIDGWDVLRTSVNSLGYIMNDFSGRFTAEIDDY